MKRTSVHIDFFGCAASSRRILYNVGPFIGLVMVYLSDWISLVKSNNGGRLPCFLLQAIVVNRLVYETLSTNKATVPGTHHRFDPHVIAIDDWWIILEGDLLKQLYASQSQQFWYFCKIRALHIILVACQSEKGVRTSQRLKIILFWWIKCLQQAWN